jgi:tetratricopeptide (TPR) repeat protein
MRWSLRTAILLILAAALAACNSNERQLLGQAEARWREGNYEDAIRLNTLLYERDHQGRYAAMAMLNIGNIYYLNLRQLRNAVEWYEKLLDEMPGHEEEYAARRQLAGIYAATGDLTQAIAQYGKLLEIKNLANRDEILFERAGAYFKKEDFDRALRELQRLEESGISGHLADQVCLKIGNIYQIRHRYDDAAGYFQKVSQAGCRECRRQAILDLAETYEAFFDFERAVETIRRLDPGPENEAVIAREVSRLQNKRKRVDSGPVPLWDMTHR